MRADRGNRTAEQPSAKQLFEALETLCKHVDQLSKDVRRLSDRIEPFDGETEPQSRPWLQAVRGRAKTPTVKAFYEILKQAERQLQAAEFDVNAIRAKLTEISDDVLSREDIKPFLKTGEASIGLIFSPSPSDRADIAPNSRQ